MLPGNNEQLYPFLNGGGEMGALTRSKDWSKTILGDPLIWPQSLRTTISIILNSKFPMFLWWGPELICFYNDAYRPSLGHSGKHPQILGLPAEEAWPEIWHIIKPLIDSVLAGEGATWSEDQLIPIYRNGRLEDVYWTYSYSPVNDESGLPGGVLVTCFESTEKIKILKEIKDREDQLNFTIDAAEIGTWDLNPATSKFIGNDRLKSWFGLQQHEAIELETALTTMAEKDRQRVISAISNAMAEGSDGNYEIEYDIKNAVTQEERTVIAKGKAVFGPENKAYRFSGILQDITDQVRIRKKLEESERAFRNTVVQVPVGITIFRGYDFIVEMANKTYLEVVDRREEDFVGRSLFESLPEVRTSVEELLTNVMTTGVPYYGTEFPVTLNRFGKKELTFFNFVYQPFREENGDVSGIIVVAIEVTDSVKAKQAITESERQFRNLVMQSPIPMTIFRGPDFIIEIANRVMIYDIWQRSEADVIGKKLLDVFPELKTQKYPDLLRKVLAEGITHSENESIAYVQHPDGLKKFYLDYEYAPLFGTNNSISGIIITVNDVTEKVEARKKVEDAEQRLRLALEATSLGTWELDLINKTIVYSPRLAEIFGHDPYKIMDHQVLRSQVHPDDENTIVKPAYDMALKTGIYYYEARIIKPNNSITWLKTHGQVFFDEAGSAYKIIGTVQDITEDKKHQQELQESEQKFRTLADSMPQFIWTGDDKGNLNYFNQSVFQYSGLTPEQIAKDGWLQIVHPDEREENISKWTNAIASGSDFLFEHRFRRSDGTYRWQLSRAIPQRDANGVIQMWVGSSTDIEDQKIFASELERQVHDRTVELEEKNNELEKMNAELKSFAYVSSHDLQEPLRKIQTFSSRIMDKESDHLSDKGRDYFRRIQDAASRMQTLIQDLLSYSRTSSSERVFTVVDLNELLDEVKSDLQETIIEKGAIIESTKMCKARVIAFQFRQLMHNLIGNSLKFAKAGRTPHIKILSEIIPGNKMLNPALDTAKNYCHIVVSDNGIGFDPEYKERIFEVFQRLHGKDEYRGTGIGLAIARKIVENHHGIITATGVVNMGATFDIYLPVQN